MSRSIITGATGYLGSHLVASLLEHGYTILCPIVRQLPIAYLEPFEERVSLLYTDEQNYTTKITDFAADIVMHTACRYERDGTTLEELLDANLLFPLKIMYTIAQQKEKKPLWLNTDTALDKYLNGYALSKHHFAEWGKYYSQKGDFTFVNVMLEQFYGEGDSGSKFIPFLLNKMKNDEPIDLTDGEQRRDFIYVDDVVAAFMFLAKKELTGFHEIPLGTGEAPQVRKVVEYLKEITESHSELRFGAIPRRENEPECLMADMKLLEGLGFRCQYDWKSGLEKTIQISEHKIKGKVL